MPGMLAHMFKDPNEHKSSHAIDMRTRSGKRGSQAAAVEKKPQPVGYMADPHRYSALGLLLALGCYLVSGVLYAAEWMNHSQKSPATILSWITLIIGWLFLLALTLHVFQQERVFERNTLLAIFNLFCLFFVSNALHCSQITTLKWEGDITIQAAASIGWLGQIVHFLLLIYILVHLAETLAVLRAKVQVVSTKDKQEHTLASAKNVVHLKGAPMSMAIDVGPVLRTNSSTGGSSIAAKATPNPSHVTAGGPQTVKAYSSKPQPVVTATPATATTASQQPQQQQQQHQLPSSPSQTIASPSDAKVVSPVAGTAAPYAKTAPVDVEEEKSSPAPHAASHNKSDPIAVLVAQANEKWASLKPKFGAEFEDAVSPPQPGAGARLIKIVPEGAMDLAQFKVGDIVIQVSEKDISGRESFKQALLVCKPLDMVSMTFKRGDAVQTTQVEVAAVGYTIAQAKAIQRVREGNVTEQDLQQAPF